MRHPVKLSTNDIAYNQGVLDLQYKLLQDAASQPILTYKIIRESTKLLKIIYSDDTNFQG